MGCQSVCCLPRFLGTFDLELASFGLAYCLRRGQVLEFAQHSYAVTRDLIYRMTSIALFAPTRKDDVASVNITTFESGVIPVVL